MMVTITCMLVVANVQSSVGESIPKTSYFKMIDYFLIYSLNIIILVMVYHTYMTAHIAEDFAPNQDDMEMERVNEGLYLPEQFSSMCQVDKSHCSRQTKWNKQR